MTPDEEKAQDLEKRVKAFNEELIPLLGKYKIGLMALPLILQDGRLAARPHIFDDPGPKKEEPKVEQLPANQPPAIAVA